MNNIEKKVYEELEKRCLNMNFGVIFCHKQFDFGNKEHRILLEVQGDYWHGNPYLFNESGTNGKRMLNNIQKQRWES